METARSPLHSISAPSEGETEKKRTTNTEIQVETDNELNKMEIHVNSNIHPLDPTTRRTAGSADTVSAQQSLQLQSHHSGHRQVRQGYESVQGAFEDEGELYFTSATALGAHDVDDALTDVVAANHASPLSTRRFWIGVVVIVQAVNLLVLAGFMLRSRVHPRILGVDDTTLASLVNWAPLPKASTVITKIAFGSCSRQDLPQPYWDTLSLTYEPDLVLLAGDNVYGDCQSLACTHLRQAYVDWSHHSSFQGAAQRFPIVATLDDHDYGQGDCHADNPYKDVARQMFLDFYRLEASDLAAPTDSSDADELDDGGVYRSYVWGPPGRRVQVILLDTRYSRSPFVATGVADAPYEPYPDDAPPGSYQMLSAAQWSWLEDRLTVKQVDLNILVSSIQVLNDRVVWEGWRHLPRERERLLQLLLDSGRPAIVVLGDRHVGGLYQLDRMSDYSPGDVASLTNYSRTVYEVTASSWTHTIPLGAFGSNCTTAETCDEIDLTRVGNLVRENHFGSIDIDWASRSFSVSLRRTESFPALDAYRRDVPSNAGEVLASFHDMQLPLD